MSDKNTNDLLIKPKHFVEFFSQVFEVDFRHRNNFRDMVISAGIYTVTVDINAFGTAYKCYHRRKIDYLIHYNQIMTI